MKITDLQHVPSAPRLGLRAKRLCSVVVVACLAIGSTGCASMTRSQKAATACMAADLATTAWGLSEGHAEANPTMAGLDDWQIVATNAALHWGLQRLLKRVPAKRSAAFWSSYAAIRCGAALHNYGVIEGGPGEVPGG